MKWLLCLLLLISSVSRADGLGGATCAPDCNAYVNGDHFQLSDYDTDVHLLLGYSTALTISLIAEHKFHMSIWNAALLGTLVTGLLGTAKEVFIDDYNSRTDTKAFWLGSLSAGLTFTVFQF